MNSSPDTPTNFKISCLRALLSVVILILPAFSWAEEVHELTRNNFRSSVCNISKMDISFEMDEAFGEPLITSQMSWSAGPNTSLNCLSGITHIWVRVRTEMDSIRYIKLRPKILSAGSGFGSRTTESPSWSYLFCKQASDASNCESESVSKKLFLTNLKFEGLEVVTEALAVSTLGSSGISSSRHMPSKAKTSDGSFSLDSILADAIDLAIEPAAPKKEIVEVVEEEAPPPVPTAEEIAEHRKNHAKEASQNVVTLISSSLAHYTSPPHTCETGRDVANWVQTRGICQLNFRSESSHDYLCADNGRPSAIKATSQTRIDFAQDVQDIPEIRHSANGWASLTLELNGELQRITEGNYKTSRWQITAADTQLDDLKQLASSLATLKEYCESSTI
ncbi:MAG: hypothetical protein VB957_17990 [Pseudomonadales bacterium]|jgi:hypothetical protein